MGGSDLLSGRHPVDQQSIPVTLTGPALRLEAAMKRSGIWRIALGADALIATATVSLVKASAERHQPIKTVQPTVRDPIPGHAFFALVRGRAPTP